MNINEKFIADCAAQAEVNCRNHSENDMNNHRGNRNDGHQNEDRQVDHGEEHICEAEASKARMFATPGNPDNLVNWSIVNPGCNQPELMQPNPMQQYSSVVDENYLVIGAHLDIAIQNKIVNNEYVDFSRLIPKDRIAKEEDHRMEIVNRGGQTFFCPSL